MSGSEYWDDIPDEVFEAFQRRVELVETLLDADISEREKREVKRVYRYAHGVSDRTIRRYLRRYRTKGPRALLFWRAREKTARIDDTELADKLVELIHESPSRSIPQLRRLLSRDRAFAGKIERVSDRTVYRFLQERSLGKKDRIALEMSVERSHYRSFEAAHSLALVQGDARDGIWITGPNDKRRKTYLFLWIDDYSRKILFGKYYLSEKLPRMEDSFKYALLRYGIPDKAYLDNGKVYISKHFAFVVSKLGITKIHHRPYQAHCKGKVESDMKIIKNEFQNEAQQADMHTLEELNTAFWAWSELSYNKRIHSAHGETPDKRFVDGLRDDQKRIKNLSWFLSLFLWRQNRKVSKYGKIRLYRNEYPITKKPAGTVVQVRFDPCDLREVFIYDGNERFLEKTWPSKQNSFSVPSIPEEHDDPPARISEASRTFFTELRREYLKHHRESNAIDFSRYYRPKEDQNDE